MGKSEQTIRVSLNLASSLQPRLALEVKMGHRLGLYQTVVGIFTETGQKTSIIQPFKLHQWQPSGALTPHRLIRVWWRQLLY